MLKKIEQIGRENVILISALLVTLVVYSQFLFYGHISWDDPEMVFKNQAVKDFQLKILFTEHFVGNYIPVTMLLHSLGYFVFETNEGGHHLASILLHLVNGFLTYKIGKRLFGDEMIGLFGCIVFLLHPLQIESVGWISELKNVLSGTFYLAGLVSYLKYKEGDRINIVWCFLFFVLGCLSKSSVVVLPLSLLCLDLFIDKKITTKDLLSKIPFFVVSVVIGLMNIKAQTEDQFINHAHEFPYYQRLAFAGFALLKYLLLFLAPVKLSVIYPYPEQKAAILATGFMMVLILLILMIYFIRKQKFIWLSVILFILVNLVLVLQFLPFGEVLFADRYLYIAIIGLGWLMGMFVSVIKLPVKIAATTFIVLFAVLSFARSQAWKSSIVLFEDILKKYPENFVALNSAGVESMFLNEDQKALDYFNRAAEVAPSNYKGFYNRGLLFLKNGKTAEAIQSFNKSIDLYNYSKAYNGRASAYYLQDDIPKAINDANMALQLEPKNAKAYFILGNCFNDLGKMDEAIGYYNKAIALNLNDPDFYFKRAIAYGKKQDFKNCLEDLQLCIALNPAYYEAYYWMGVAKVNLSQDPCPDLKVAARHNFEPAVIAYNKYCR